MTDYKSGFATIIGRPNVGKSTLLNSILGQKIAIMSDKPQTTRNKIQGFYTKENCQIVFIDTPGMHKPQHKLGEYMVTVAERTLNEVDIILYLVDATKEFGAGEEYIIKQLEKVSTPVFLIINKIDLIPREQVLQVINKYQNRFSFSEIVPVSALKQTQFSEQYAPLPLCQVKSEFCQLFHEEQVQYPHALIIHHYCTTAHKYHQEYFLMTSMPSTAVM